MLVAGVGVNDATFPVTLHAGRRQIWKCPIYTCWTNMLRRCYDPTVQLKHPTYADCSVVPQWLFFSNFYAWARDRFTPGLELDKDLLVPGNKVYSPETCTFLSKQLNRFLAERKLPGQPHPIGVTWHEGRKCFAVRCTDVNGKRGWLGWEKDAGQGHLLWQHAKLTALEGLWSRETGPVKISIGRLICKLSEDILHNRETTSLL